MNNISVRDINKYTAAYEPANAREPTEAEKKVDAVFMKFIDKEIKLEPDEEMFRRDSVLAEVRAIFINWVKFVATKVLHIPDDEAEEAGGELFISGSHRLGVRDIGADIDTVCVAPNFCTREHFFTYLKQDFLSRPEVTDLNAIEEAFVPLMSFDYRGVSIDLLFAHLTENAVPKSLDILDDNILIGLDDQTEKSLNGPRVTNMIFKLVGEKTFPNFLIVLRCIRKWAKRRGIYGNKLGYLGGVNCNILVAFICQLYPNFTPSSLLFRFFKQYKDWKWPEPIMLNNIQSNPPGAMLSEEREVWQPNHNDYMPIITPAYPAMNSAHNVSEHTFLVMQEEFIRGYECCENILKNKAWQTMNSWDTLFEPSDFFLKYPHYLACHILGTGDNAESRSWMGFVEARIRRLTQMPFLQTLPILSPIHLYPVVSKTSKSPNAICYFIGFTFDLERLKALNDKKIQLDEVIGHFQDSLVDENRGYKKERVEGLDFFVEHLPWKKLPKEVFTLYGGYDAAKEQRENLGYGTKPTKKSSSVDGEEGANDQQQQQQQTGGEGEGMESTANESEKREDQVNNNNNSNQPKESYVNTILSRYAAANAAAAFTAAQQANQKARKLVLPRNLPSINILPSLPPSITQQQHHKHLLLYGRDAFKQHLLQQQQQAQRVQTERMVVKAEEAPTGERNADEDEEGDGEEQDEKMISVVELKKKLLLQVEERIAIAESLYLKQQKEIEEEITKEKEKEEEQSKANGDGDNNMIVDGSNSNSDKNNKKGKSTKEQEEEEVEAHYPELEPARKRLRFDVPADAVDEIEVIDGEEGTNIVPKPSFPANYPISAISTTYFPVPNITWQLLDK